MLLIFERVPSSLGISFMFICINSQVSELNTHLESELLKRQVILEEEQKRQISLIKQVLKSINQSSLNNCEQALHSQYDMLQLKLLSLSDVPFCIIFQLVMSLVLSSPRSLNGSMRGWFQS